MGGSLWAKFGEERVTYISQMLTPSGRDLGETIKGLSYAKKCVDLPFEHNART